MSDQEQDEKHPYLLSMPLYAKYANFTSVRQISFDRLIIKMKDGSSNNDQLLLINKFKDLIPDYVTSGINFNSENSETLALVDQIVSLLFDVVIIITMFLCFFSLSSSMTANLFEQAKEIGILRAIGFRKIRIIMLYVYEAYILVVASSLMGIFVGVGVGWSMTV